MSSTDDRTDAAGPFRPRRRWALWASGPGAWLLLALAGPLPGLSGESLARHVATPLQAVLDRLSAPLPFSLAELLLVLLLLAAVATVVVRLRQRGVEPAPSASAAAPRSAAGGQPPVGALPTRLGPPLRATRARRAPGLARAGGRGRRVRAARARWAPGGSHQPGLPRAARPRGPRATHGRGRPPRRRPRARGELAAPGPRPERCPIGAGPEGAGQAPGSQPSLPPHGDFRGSSRPSPARPTS